MVELPTTTPEGKPIIYYQSGKKPEVYGVFLVDPKTGALGQSVFLGEYKRQHPEAEFRHIVVSEWLAKEKLRAEEKAYEREMAEKKAEVEKKAPPKSPSETWESYIEKYGTKAIIPSAFIAKQYAKQLRKKAEEEAKKIEAKRPTTAAEFAARFKIKQREKRLEEEAKKAEKERTFLVSEKFMKLWEERKPEIERVLEREAGLKAWREERIKKEKELEEERKRIEPFREIWQMKPSIKKIVPYYKALITKPKGMEKARRELKYEAIMAKRKKEEWLLTGAAPALHPKKVAFAVGALALPVIKILKPIPLIGKIVAGKKFAYTAAGLYGLGKGVELTMKYKAEPTFYKRPSGIVELALEPVTELGAFAAGAATTKAIAGISRAAMVKAGIETYKLKEPTLRVPKGKPIKPREVRIIKVDTTKFLKGKPKIEKITVRTRGLLGKRDIVALVRKPVKFMGLKKPRIKIELVGKKAPPLKEAISIDVTKPPKKFDFPLVIRKRGRFVDLFKGIVKSYKTKPFEIKVKKKVITLADLFKKPKPVEIKTKGIREAVRSITRGWREKPITIEKYTYRPSTLYKYAPIKKVPPVEVKVKFPPKVKKIPFEFGIYKYRPAGLYRYEPPKPKVPFISVKRVVGKPPTRKIYIDLARPFKEYELRFRLPKAYAEITRQEIGFPPRLEKAWAIKGRLADITYAKISPYVQAKLKGKPFVKGLEMYWRHPTIIQVGERALIGEKFVSYPRGLIKYGQFRKITLPPLLGVPPKAPTIFKAKPPAPLRKGEVEVGVGRQKLVQITKQITKQELKTEQKLKQVSKLRQRQMVDLGKLEKFTGLAGLMVGRRTGLERALRIGQVSALGKAVGVTLISEQALAQKQAQAQAQAQVQAQAQAQAQAKALVRIQVPALRRIQVPKLKLMEELMLEYPRPPPAILIPPIKPPYIPKKRKPKKRKPFELFPTYKPSLVGVWKYKKFGITIPEEPPMVSLGERLLTKQMEKDIAKIGRRMI